MVPKYQPTPKMVVALWEYMAAKYDLTIVKKNKSRLMKLIAWFLSSFDILDKERFMSHFSTTIGTTIYIPFNVGEAIAKWSLASQIAIIVHETRHAIQYRTTSKGKLGDLLFYWRYLVSDFKRAGYEIQAYIHNMELYHWATGRLLDIEVLANKLYSYNCEQPEVLRAQEAYGLTNERLRGPMPEYDPLVQEVIDWLNTEGQQYLEQGA